MKQVILASIIMLSLGSRGYSQMTDQTCVRRMINYSKWHPDEIVKQLTLFSNPWQTDSNYIKNGIHVISLYKEPYRLTIQFKDRNGMLMLTTPPHTFDIINADSEMESLGLKKHDSKKDDDGHSIEIWDNLSDYKPNPTMIVVQYYLDRITYTTELTNQ